MVDAGPRNSVIEVGFRRGELFYALNIPRKRIQKVKYVSGAARFGIEVAPARDFRAHGFYNHYATYAEVLQLIGSLAFGFLLACPRRRLFVMAALSGAGIMFILALGFTATRAPLVGLIVSILSMILMTRSLRRMAVILLVVVALPAGLYSITKWRGVDFVDTSEGSTAWRLQVWSEGVGLIKRDPILGIGKGSERTHWREWGLFQGGKLPPGHFHSTPMQVAVWWGLPALIFYLGVMFMALRTLARYLLGENGKEDWRRRAIVLGAFGGVIGFNFSSLVHFNFGDGEVVMVLWLILGLAVAVVINHKDTKSTKI
jgi:O-antigen ligase